MSIYLRRSYLRDSFAKILSKSFIRIRIGKLKGRYLFRAAVRKVLEYIKWLVEEPVVEEVTDDVAANIRIDKKKIERRTLTLQDRSYLFVDSSERSTSDNDYILGLFNKLQTFKKYSEKLRESLAAVCVYQYLPPNRVIVRQGRKAENLYYIVNGEVSLSRVVIDDFTNDTKEVDMGLMYPGDMFGEIALLHKIPRTATIISKTIVDLILIPSEDFDRILKDTLMKEWNVLQDALVHFDYFKTWDDSTIRECCILSKLQNFRPNEVLLGDGKGMVNYVHFILEGECRLIEHLMIKEQTTKTGTRYELFDSENVISGFEEQSVTTQRNTDVDKEKIKELKTKSTKIKEDADESEHDLREPIRDYTKMFLSTKSIQKRVDFERSSIVTSTLLDVVNAWHEITDIAEMLMREPSVTYQSYPSDVRTVFMQVCLFYRGACFGLGEQMYNRRIVSVTPVRCFLVPRYWLLEHNRANIWNRIKMFMDYKLPSKEELFKKFVNNRKWIKYKKNLIDDIFMKGRRARDCVTAHDVPYSIRIIQEINSKL